MADVRTRLDIDVQDSVRVTNAQVDLIVQLPDHFTENGAFLLHHINTHPDL